MFHQPDQRGLESALSRAIGLWHYYPDEFHRTMLVGMRQNHSWARPGEDYVRIYDHIRHG